MNCFHFWVSLRYYTTYNVGISQHIRLWIAFIFEYLWDITQPNLVRLLSSHRCELLSFLSIFEILHNSMNSGLMVSKVVNCFHFWVSLRYYTTSIFFEYDCHTLWIAFIFEYLWDITQRWVAKYTALFSCELLSFLSIFEILHNNVSGSNPPISVVNCFHFWVSLRYYTTCNAEIVPHIRLWIAFIFEYLWDITQRLFYWV